MTGELDVSSIPERIHAVLRERIREGDLPPGSRLHQSQLSVELGVSRTPLREAISRLAAEGLVELLPQRGARVAEVRPEAMDDAYAARLVIEPAAAALAAAAPDETALRAMDAAIVEHRRHVQRPDLAFQANRAFHLALVAASGNHFLERFAQMLWMGRLGRTIYLTQDEPPAFIRKDADEHAAIAAAVRAGDPKRAERLTYEHIAAARILLHQALADEAA